MPKLLMINLLKLYYILRNLYFGNENKKCQWLINKKQYTEILQESVLWHVVLRGAPLVHHIVICSILNYLT